jgi:REP element-mobilizing transposase RayT
VGYIYDVGSADYPRYSDISKMAHTHTNLLFHIIFSTQGFLPLIATELKGELFAYMGGLVNELKGKPIIINGTSDHVHMLILLPPNVSLSDAMRFIKGNSSRWMTEKYGIKFAWQKGFGAFSVSRSNAEAVVGYIKNQETHHAKADFVTEYISLLDKNEVKYDSRYLWA